LGTVRHTALAIAAASLLARTPAESQSADRTPDEAPTATTLASEATEVPFLELHGVPAVEVRLNGRGPYRLIVEWGANLLALSPRVQKELALRPRGIDPLGNPVVAIESLRVGDATFSGLAAAVDPFFDGKDEDGVMGVNVYAELLATLDFPVHRFRLEKGALPAADGQLVLSYSGPPGGEPHVKVELSGRTESALLDTGAAANVVIPRARSADFKMTGASADRSAAEGPGMSESPVADTHLAGDLTLGAYVIASPPVRLAPRPKLILGAGFLRCFSVTLDQRSRRVRFTRPAGSCESAGLRPR